MCVCVLFKMTLATKLNKADVGTSEDVQLPIPREDDPGFQVC